MNSNKRVIWEVAYKTCRLVLTIRYGGGTLERRWNGGTDTVSQIGVSRCSPLCHFDKAQRMERYQRPLDGARDDKKGLRMTWEKDREDFIWILFGSFGYYSYI